MQLVTLDKLSKLKSETLRAIAITAIPVFGMIVGAFGWDEGIFSAKAALVIDRVLALWTALGLAYIADARINKPNPPLSDKAVDATMRLVDEGKLTVTATSMSNSTLASDYDAPVTKQAGRIALMFAPLLFGLSAVSVVAATLALQGCTSTSFTVRTPTQRLDIAIQTADISVTAVRSALRSDLISAAQATSFLNNVREYRALLGTVTDLMETGQPGATSMLSYVEQSLLTLQNFLAEREKEKARG